MANLAFPAPVAKFQFTDNAGTFLNGGKLFTYLAGTTTKANTYADAGEVTTNANPVVLDAAGRASVFLPPGVFYKFVLAPSTDTDPPTNAIWTVDAICAQANGVPWAVDTGTANAMVCSNVVGMGSTVPTGAPYPTIVCMPANAPTGACTINVNGWGAIAIKDAGGNAIANGAWAANQPLLLAYDGTNWRTTFYGAGSFYAADTGAQNAMVATVAAVPSTATMGAWCLVKAISNPSGAATANINGWGAIAMKDKAGNAISNNLWATGQILLLIYDGTNWRTLI